MGERHLGPWSYHTNPLDWTSLLSFGPEGLPESRLALSFGLMYSFSLRACNFVDLLSIQRKLGPFLNPNAPELWSAAGHRLLGSSTLGFLPFG